MQRKLLYSLLISAALVLCSNPASGQETAQVTIRRAPDLGTLLTLKIWIDGKSVAVLPRGQTYRVALTPGRHLISVQAIPSPKHLYPTEMDLDAESGRTYDFTAKWKSNELILE